ncbi:MAG: heparan-alpha-glucosaminide N-acetyltransferase domain-containing protein [Ancrocorticia sp.]
MDITATHLDSSGLLSHNDDGALSPSNGPVQFEQGPVDDRRSMTRYVGVDIARFLAIIGMMSAHLIAVQSNFSDVSPFELGAAHLVEMIAAGTSAALFAVLGGVSTVFATRRLLAEGRAGAARLAVVVRGVVLIVIGLLLGFIPGSIAVVLTYYGVSMILIAPLLTAPNWLLAGLSGLLAVVGPFNASVREGLGIGIGGEELVDMRGTDIMTLVSEPLESLRAWLLTGVYPAVTWCVYLMVGMMIGRFVVSADARDQLKKAAIRLLAIGVPMAIVARLVSWYVVSHLEQFGFTGIAGLTPENFFAIPADQQHLILFGVSFGAPVTPDPWAQLLATPHSGSVIDLMYTIGTSLAVVALMVLALDVALVGRRNRLVETVRCTGAAPLTIYSLHVIVTGVLFIAAVAMMPETGEFVMPWWGAGTKIFALQLSAALMIGAVLAATKRKGPLEALLSKIVQLVVRKLPARRHDVPEIG